LNGDDLESIATLHHTGVERKKIGVHISYDRMASLLAPYGDRDVLGVARGLDAKVDDVLSQAAA
jgi:hypothetical protein